MSDPRPSSYPGASDPERTEIWRAVLTMPGLAPFARFFRWLPGQHRCPLCYAPYNRTHSARSSVATGVRPLRALPAAVQPCFRDLANHPGGAEVSITVLFADVRGSTTIAEQSSAADFSQLLHDFYALVTDAVQAEGGIVDKFLGDGVMALFIPRSPSGMTRQAPWPRPAHPRRGHLPVGVGVNTGPAYTGFLGPTAEVAGFSAVGDAVNVAHRLGESAGAGELIVAAETATQAALPDRWRRGLDDAPALGQGSRCAGGGLEPAGARNTRSRRRLTARWLAPAVPV